MSCVPCCLHNLKAPAAGHSKRALVWYTPYMRIMPMRPLVFLCAVFLFVSMSGHVSAHGTGVSYEENKNGYLIDIGHDEFIAADESTRFDFTIYPDDLESIEGEVFTDVWVTFTKDKQLFFAGGIHKPMFGATGFTYVFPEEGTYTVSTRFQKDGETVVETQFPLEVIPPLETESGGLPPFAPYALFAIGGLLLGGAIGLFIPKNHTKSI